jgi:hypothetical protein
MVVICQFKSIDLLSVNFILAVLEKNVETVDKYLSERKLLWKKNSYSTVKNKSYLEECLFSTNLFYYLELFERLACRKTIWAGTALLL